MLSERFGVLMPKRPVEPNGENAEEHHRLLWEFLLRIDAKVDRLMFAVIAGLAGVITAILATS